MKAMLDKLARPLRRHNPEAHYWVMWETSVWAESPEDAAWKALNIQRDPESIATVFHVRRDGYDEFERFDLEEIDEDRSHLSEP